jgi:hypothetical protein
VGGVRPRRCGTLVVVCAGLFNLKARNVVRPRPRGRPGMGARKLWRRDHAPLRVVEPHLRHGLLTHHRGRVDACGQGQLGKGGMGGDGPALVAQRLQAAEGGDGERGHLVKARIGATVSGEDGQRAAVPAGEVLQGGKSVRPVGLAADQANEDGPCGREGALGVGVDGYRMLQRDDVGEADGGLKTQLSSALIASREGPEVAVREAEHHQIGRVLAEVEGGLGFLQPVAFAEDDVHRSRLRAGQARPPHPSPTAGEGGRVVPEGGEGMAHGVRSPAPCGSPPHRCRHARR